ncbi:hypothetical protein [Aphanothece sacrum]|uniref:Uncharacterized protein n=1 Tax=Aphanothece sacrum FPU1 TaxID=1920663 RepID=A0A401IHU6_APHSA|nr:hypothetical protein [Aphanothece sacrum]GBF80885.1 hypothetical protein AsFPU1_2293 [Aphanothece sacrum FPU1]GBF85192.1 hypothetical protein AsFPU3_2250 [Aphanothece sacrum FPU3]
MSKIKIDNLELNPQLIEENSLKTLKDESDLNKIRGGLFLSGCKGWFGLF